MSLTFDNTKSLLLVAGVAALAYAGYRAFITLRSGVESSSQAVSGAIRNGQAAVSGAVGQVGNYIGQGYLPGPGTTFGNSWQDVPYYAELARRGFGAALGDIDFFSGANIIPGRDMSNLSPPQTDYDLPVEDYGAYESFGNWNAP